MVKHSARVLVLRPSYPVLVNRRKRERSGVARGTPEFE